MEKIHTITASNGIILTTDDLKEAIKNAEIQWDKVAYAFPKVKSKEAFDICVYDFFEDNDSWNLVDNIFVEECQKGDSDKKTILANTIKKRAEVWYGTARSKKKNEELLYRADKKPFSLDYAKLYIKCTQNPEYEETSVGTRVVVTKATSYVTRSGYDNVQHLLEYKGNFTWGDVEYRVTLWYPEEQAAYVEQKTAYCWDNPNYITIEVSPAIDLSVLDNLSNPDNTTSAEEARKAHVKHIMDITKEGINEMFEMPVQDSSLQKNAHPTNENDEENTTDLSWMEDLPESIHFPDSHSK